MIIILTVIDQMTKYFAVLFLKDGRTIPIIKDVFELQYLENRGAAFGIMENRQWFFMLMTCAAIAVLTYIYMKIPDAAKYVPLKLCYVFLTAGAVGNLIDRGMQGYVVDFFYFKLIDFPVFNVADIYVTVTMAVLLLLILFYYKEEELDFLNRKGNHGRNN